MAVKVGKSQASFYLRRHFGCASLLTAKRKKDRPDPYLTVTLAGLSGGRAPALP